MSKKIVANVFNYARAEGASGLVITSQADRVALHYHFPDDSRRELSLPKKLEPAFRAGLREILGLADGELLARKYYRISDPQFRLDFYLSVLPAAGQEKIIIDIIRRPETAWRLPQLGLQRRDRQDLENALRHPGLIVISSPAGGGKSSTLRAILSRLDRPDKNICLLEKAPAADYGETDETTALTGVNRLGARLTDWTKARRQDSDIIAADDGADDSRLTEAITSASEGRLVLTTLAADDALDALIRILQIDLPLRLKLDALKMIVGQRLVALKPERRTGRAIRQEIGLFEILRWSPEMKKFILAAAAKDLTSPKFREKLRTLAISNGFRPLETDRRAKARAGLL